MKKIISVLCLTLFILTSCQQAKQKIFEQAALEVNKQCPMNVDNVTRLDSANYTAADNSFYYYYTLINVPNDSATIAAAKQGLEKSLPETIKANKEMELFKQMDVNINYVYLSDSTKAELFRVEVTPEMYKKP